MLWFSRVEVLQFKARRFKVKIWDILRGNFWDITSFEAKGVGKHENFGEYVTEQGTEQLPEPLQNTMKRSYSIMPQITFYKHDPIPMEMHKVKVVRQFSSWQISLIRR